LRIDPHYQKEFPNETYSPFAAATHSLELRQATYVYDSLSQMTSETRAFSGVGSYQLSYSYNLAGELTGMTNPWNVWTGYSYDNNGRLNRVHADGSMQM
jgi:YD repeat-containing protein